MIEFIAVATGLCTLAYLVFAAAAQSQGLRRLLGHILGWWLLVLVAAAFVMLVVLPIAMGLSGQTYDRWLNES